MSSKEKRIRFVYRVFFGAIFIAAAPFVIFYSLGYDLGKNFSVFKTGGIYVYAGETGASIFINDKLENVTSVFQHGILIKNLSAKLYAIKAQKPGYMPWNKNIVVAEERVSEAYPFFVPVEPQIIPVPQRISQNGTSSIPVKNPEYANILALFDEPSDPLATSTRSGISSATSSSRSKTNVRSLIGLRAATTTAKIPSIEKDKIVLENLNNKLTASWKGRSGSTPFFFCLLEGGLCEPTILAYSGNAPIGHFEFFPTRNDVVIFVEKNSIYVTELDKRPPQNTVPLYASTSTSPLDFRILDNDTLALKEGANIKKLRLVYEE